MKFIAYSDAHFHHNWPEFNPQMPSGLSRWLEIQLGIWKDIHDLAINYEVDATLFAGDLVHKRAFVHTTQNNSLLDLYKNYHYRPEYMISGNHDRLDQNFNAVQAFDGIGEAVVLSDRNGWQITQTTTRGTYLICGAKPGGAIPTPPEISFPVHTKILLAHGVLNGAQSASGFELKGGYNLSDFKEWDLVILGDIHKRQIHGNVLIPGAPLQQNWGDEGMSCGCWLIDTEEYATAQKGIGLSHNAKMEPVSYRIGDSPIGVRFLPIKAPKFISVTQENLKEVLEQEKNDFDYFDFRLVQELPKSDYKELKKRFPQSYFGVQRKEEDKRKSGPRITKKNSLAEVLGGYWDIHLSKKSATREAFAKAAMHYLLQANPKLEAGKGSFKDIQIDWVAATNFLSFESIRVDISKLTAPVYQITGTSDEETSLTNGVGKSTFAVEILSYVLFDQLARTKSRSKDRLIHDPHHLGKGKDLLCECGLTVNNQSFIIQRYRRHKILGSGSRILKKS